MKMMYVRGVTSLKLLEIITILLVANCGDRRDETVRTPDVRFGFALLTRGQTRYPPVDMACVHDRRVRAVTLNTC